MTKAILTGNALFSAVHPNEVLLRKGVSTIMGKQDQVVVTYHSVLAIADREQAGYRKGAESVAGMLFNLAVSCKDSGMLETGIGAAETERKAALAQKAVKLGWTPVMLKDAEKIPACWKQAKSELLAMFRPIVDKGFGIHPNEFKSFSELHIKLNELRKLRNKGNTKPKVKQQNEGTDAAADVLAEVPTGVKGEFLTLVGLVMELPETKQKEILRAFSDIVEPYYTTTTEAANDDSVEVESDNDGEVTESDVDALEDAQVAQAVAATG